MDSMPNNLGRTVAPLLTMAMVWGGVNSGWAFAANAVSFIAFGVVLWRLTCAQPPNRSGHPGEDGFLIARKGTPILILLLMVAAVTVADDPDFGPRPGPRQATARFA